MAANNVIELRDVGKAYDGVRALDGVNLDVQKGEWLAIIGPSGSGKSTLLNIMGGLDTPTKGAVRVLGLDLTKLSQNELAKFRRLNVGFVFQQFHLVPYLTAVENVMLAQYFHSVVDEEQAVKALVSVGLSHRKGHLPSQLSSGEQQRVCIARALINDPTLLFADEPTGNLDQANGRLVLDIFKNLHRERQVSIVLVTHDMEVAKMAQRRVRMVDGTLTETV